MDQLLLLKYFMPNLILNGQTTGKEVNIVPLFTPVPQDIETSLLNILLLVPFGFGLPFITTLRMNQVNVLGALVSIAIELLQLNTGALGKITFRVADNNDVFFNSIGVAIGYLLLIQFVRIYRKASPNWEISANPLLRHIADRPQIPTQPGFRATTSH